MTVMTAAPRVPYDAKHVVLIDEGHRVTALWTPDADQAANPASIDLLDRANDAVEVIATIRRVYKSEGWNVSGWLIDLPQEQVLGDFAASNKRDAMRVLRNAITAYFTR